MTNLQDHRALRWYPRSWRARHGAGLSALIEEFSEEGSLPWRDRIDLMLAGLSTRYQLKRRSNARRLRVVPLRVVSGVIAVVIVATLFFGAYRSQTTGPPKLDNGIKQTAVVQLGGTAVITVAVTMKIRKHGQ